MKTGEPKPGKGKAGDDEKAKKVAEFLAIRAADRKSRNDAYLKGLENLKGAKTPDANKVPPTPEPVATPEPIATPEPVVTPEPIVEPENPEIKKLTDSIETARNSYISEVKKDKEVNALKNKISKILSFGIFGNGKKAERKVQADLVGTQKIKYDEAREALDKKLYEDVKADLEKSGKPADVIKTELANYRATIQKELHTAEASILLQERAKALGARKAALVEKSLGRTLLGAIAKPVSIYQKFGTDWGKYQKFNVGIPLGRDKKTGEMKRYRVGQILRSAAMAGLMATIFTPVGVGMLSWRLGRGAVTTILGEVALLKLGNRLENKKAGFQTERNAIETKYNNNELSLRDYETQIAEIEEREAKAINRDNKMKIVVAALMIGTNIASAQMENAHAAGLAIEEHNAVVNAPMYSEAEEFNKAHPWGINPDTTQAPTPGANTGVGQSSGDQSFSWNKDEQAINPKFFEHGNAEPVQDSVKTNDNTFSWDKDEQAISHKFFSDNNATDTTDVKPPVIIDSPDSIEQPKPEIPPEVPKGDPVVVVDPEHITDAGKVVEGHPFEVKVSSNGALQTVLDIKKALALQYPDPSLAPANIQHILNTDHVKLTEEFGLYDPKAVKESAMMLSGSTVEVGSDGTITLHNLGKEDTILSSVKGGAKYHDTMFDSDHSGSVKASGAVKGSAVDFHKTPEGAEGDTARLGSTKSPDPKVSFDQNSVKFDFHKIPEGAVDSTGAQNATDSGAYDAKGHGPSDPNLADGGGGGRETSSSGGGRETSSSNGDRETTPNSSGKNIPIKRFDDWNYGKTVGTHAGDQYPTGQGPDGAGQPGGGNNPDGGAQTQGNPNNPAGQQEPVVKMSPEEVARIERIRVNTAVDAIFGEDKFGRHVIGTDTDEWRKLKDWTMDKIQDKDHWFPIANRNDAEQIKWVVDQTAIEFTKPDGGTRTLAEYLAEVEKIKNVPRIDGSYVKFLLENRPK